ncbi:hypothetical protein [Demequina sp. NBRC 110056]|uniref:hypothetical protein n=1 Tax=Demequina sp. NBRC 110056 TaxID=1570345 RepID=UPI0009FD8C42|nr:hypothetical protein [Demequina sp. NBRC 110056]
MSFEQRQTAIGLAISLVAVLTYAGVVAVRALTDDLPLTEVAWQGPLLVTIGAGGALYAAVYVVGLIRTRGQRRTDERDRQIRTVAESTGAGLAGLGVLAALVMLALDVDTFYVANVLLLMTWLGSVAEAGTALAAYREGLDA